MRKFILLDPSLAKPGGHHYELAVNLTTATARAGYEVIVAAHRRMAPTRLLPGTSRILRVFGFSTYKGDSVVWGRVALPVNPYQPVRSGLGAMEARARGWSPGAWWASCRESLRRRRQQLLCRTFQKGCERLVESVALHADDIVFLPTMTEFDLVGLARFLQENPAACRASWHLWFHNPFLPGHARPASNTRLVTAMSRHFRELLAGLPADCRLHFHATTRSLAEQYNEVLPGRFDVLPYVATPDLNVASRSGDGRALPAGAHAARPLHFVCAGGARPDKGSGRLSDLVSDLWEEFLAPGRLQLRIQLRKRSRMPQPPPTGAPARGLEPPLVHVPHPLAHESYVELLRGADCGLFLYDVAQYATRCSAVLIEMLCCGVPVMVPAGTWLADEIADEVQAHRRELLIQRARLTTLAGQDLPWQSISGDADGRRRADGPLSARPGDSLSTPLTVPSGAAALHIMVCQAQRPGTAYVRGELQDGGTSGDPASVVADTVRLREWNDPASIWLPLPPGAQEMELRLSCPFADGQLATASVRLDWMAGSGTEATPTSRVGLIVADPTQWSRLFRELLACYPHYRQSAGAFASSYRQWHTAEALLRHLECRDSVELAESPRPFPSQDSLSPIRLHAVA